MDEYKDYFVHGNKKMGIKGCVANGIAEDKANELWDVMALAASYSFNKSHAVAYSVHSIRTAWLSYYYPYEYTTAVLNSFANDIERLSKYLDIARKNGMKLLAPSISGSEEKFTTDGTSIQIGFANIRGISAVAQDFVTERGNGNFTGFEEFLERMSYYQNFGKRTIIPLVLTGMLDGYCGSRKCKIDQIETLSEYVRKLREYRKKTKEYNEKISAYEQTMEENPTAKLRKPKEPAKPVLAITEYDDEMDKFELLKAEKEYTGMYISGNPMDLFREYIGKCSDCSTVKEGHTAVCGIVSETTRKVSKKGNAFYTFKIENNGIMSGLMFCKSGEKIEDGEAVKLEGNVTNNEFGSNIMVETKESLSVLRSVCEEFKDIEIEAGSLEECKALSKIGWNRTGKRKVTLVYGDKKKTINNVEITPAIAEDIISIVGLDRIKEVKPE